MAGLKSVLICLGACVAFAACPSGPSSDPASSAAGEAAALERKAAHIEGLQAWRPVAGRVLDALLSALPDRAWLTEISYDAGKVRIKGIASSNNLLADYIARLGDSPALTGLTLGASTMKTVRGRESWEFALAAAAADPPSEAASTGVDPAAHLAELEKALPSRQDSAATLREIQRLVLDSGLQMTKFAPGAEVQGEFTVALPIAIELAGGRDEIAGFLRGLSALPGLWTASKFSLKAVSPDDPRSDARVSIAARAHFSR